MLVSSVLSHTTLPAKPLPVLQLACSKVGSSFYHRVAYANALIFTEAGWLGRQAILMTGVNSIVYILSTLPPSVILGFLPGIN